MNQAAMNSTCCQAAAPSTGEGSSQPDQPGSPAQPPDPADPVEIHVQADPGAAAGMDMPWLRDRIFSAARLIAQRSGRPVGRVGVQVVRDARMAALHQRHLGLKDSTDVLTFDLSEPGADAPADIQIAVCADQALRHAAELRHPATQELLLYVVHGLLHCAGFDDRTDNAAAAMHAEEDRILARLGVGPTYRGRSNTGGAITGGAAKDSARGKARERPAP